MKRKKNHRLTTLIIVCTLAFSTAGFSQSAPYITETYPESWGILKELDSLNFTFNEVVNEVTGKSIVIYHAGDGTPAMTFTIPSASVTGSGTNSISVDLGAGLQPGNYYVNIDQGAYQNMAGNDFAGITDADTWKISIINIGLIENSITWSGNIAVYSNLQINGNLTIDPGTHVKFMGHYKIDNWGGLYAEGTENDSIHFFANDTTTGWKGLRFYGWGKISYCHIRDGNALAGNNQEGFGGAIYLNQGANLPIEHSTFSHNRAIGQGGAIYCYSSNPVIRNNIFRNNTCDMGGAISVNLGSNPKIENNLFINNSASEHGGGILFAEQSNGTVYNNTFSQNHAGYGGAVSCIMGSNPVFTNCIFYDNQASQGGNEINVSYYTYTPGKPDFYYCLIEGGKAGIHGNYTGQYENNIETDPQFFGTGNHPFSLLKGSPCVNTGDPATSAADVGTVDLSGGPRFLNERIDMGAYERLRVFEDSTGSALSFNGSSHYVNVPNSAEINLTDNFTIEAWIKPESFKWLDGIVSKYQNPNADGFTLRLTSNAPYSGIEFNGQSTPTGVLESNQWYHIAAVRQSGANHIYINGLEQDLTGTGSPIYENNDPLCIGVDYLHSPRYFDGLIDEVRIWNAPRTAGQIRENMNLQLMGSESGLAGYWQFNNGIGSTAYDQMEINNGTLNNMDDVDWISSTIPFGSGQSNTQIVSFPETVTFTDTDVEMVFYAKAGTDTIVVRRIDAIPNTIPDNCDEVFSGQYWVISKYRGGLFGANVSFTISEDLTTEDETGPHHISLYKRKNNGGSEWQRLMVATSVNAATNTATFDGVDEFGQFILGRYTDTIAPVITETYPESWGILQTLDHLEIEFDEVVEDVNGKSVVIYHAGSNTPARTITLPSSAVTGSGSETITIALDPALPPGNYYVGIDEGAFTDMSFNDFAGITDTDTWKITVLEVGVIEGNTSWSGNVAVYTDITVNGKLTIDPGTHVKFMGHYKIDNWGGFYAEGTENDSIHFFANDTAAGWKGVRFHGWGKISYCHIRDGNALADNNFAGFGGAIYLSQGANPPIEHSTFYRNRAVGQGGAIYCQSGNPVIRNNIFRNNTCDMGGAISVNLGSNPKIENNLFINNSASEQGGGILFAGQSNGTVYNNTFSQNHAAYGGAVSCIQASNPVFTNCIFYDNQADHGGNEVNVWFYTYTPGKPGFYYCLVEDGKDSIHGNYSGNYENNIDDNPIFIETGDKPFSLLKSSPCVNTGDPTTTTAEVGNTDLAGGPRFLHGQIDMGAYEILMTPDGFAGTALDFDGTSNFVNISNNNSLNLTDDFTIEAWIYPKSFNWLSGIVSKYQTAGADGYTLRLSGNSPYTGILFNGQETPIDVLEANHWYHIASVRKSGNNYVYINGVQQTLSGEGSKVDENTDPLTIGVDYLNSPRYFDGLIDEVRIWNVPRNEEQIRENMYLTLPPNTTGLVSYWQFNAGKGNGLADIVGANRGKLRNMNDDDWVNSTLPFGDGNSNTQIVSTTGKQFFPNTGIEMDFLQKSGTDTITVTKIDTLPNRLPAGGETILDNNYWVINPFGEGTFNTQLFITTENELSAYDELNPSSLILFSRENTSDTSWSFVRQASSVDAQNNSITFDSITGFGQFTITRNEFDHYPGHALQFDTGAGYVTLANESQFDFDTAFTLETWLYLDSMSVDYHTILSKGNAWELRLVYADDAIMLEFSINKGDQELAVTYLTDTASMLHKWNHISCVYQRIPPNANINLYLNGIEGTPAPAEHLIPNNEAVQIGESFKGRLDELRFWESARTTQQIRESMHLTLGYPFEGLVSNFQLNEGEGTTVKDPFEGNYGSLTNFTPPAGWVQSHIPFGGGHSNTQTEQSGTVVFNGTGVSMDFDWPPGASITVSRIDTIPNSNPAGIADVLDRQYWVVERYGEGEFFADFSFSPYEDLEMDDADNPGQIKLYHRPSNSSREWVLIDSANQVDLSINEVRFDEINQTGQFIIGRRKPFSGYPGTALQFDGVNDYVSGNGVDTSLSAFTIEAWIKHDSLPAEVQRYITIEPEVAVLRYDGTIYGGYGELHFYIKKPSGHFYDIRVDSVLVTGKWLHVSGTYDGINMKLYLNGNLLSTKAPAAGLYAPNGDFTFGGSDETMNGDMDEIRIWDFARTETQIREGMHRVINMSEEGLTYYWQFNEGSGTIAADTVSGLVGTLHNMDIPTCWTESTIPAGMGISNTQLVETTGTVNFDPTDLTMDFTAKTGNDSIVVTKINITPNINPVGDYTAFDSQNWVINSFGENNFTARLTFQVNETLEMSDEYTPSRIKLFSRTSNSDSSWVLLSSAYSVDVAERHITFDSIQHFSQFIIARAGSNSHSPGNCLYFDGIDDFVAVPANTFLDNNEFTIEFWMSTSNPIEWAGIIDKGKHTQSDWYFLTGSSGQTEGVVFGIGHGASPVVEISSSWNDTDWHHVAGTYDRFTMKLYVDGILIGERSVTMFNSLNTIHFGNRKTGDHFFNGKLDEIRMWHHALSESQIREQMHKVLTGNESTMVSYWMLDESSGNIAHDYSNVNDAILHNMTNNSWQQSTAPVPYFTVTDGDWESAGSWALGQNAPGQNWARARIEHQINLNSNVQIMELIINSEGVLTVLTGFTLIISE